MEKVLPLGRSYEKRCKKPLPSNTRISTIGSVWSGRGKVPTSKILSMSLTADSYDIILGKPWHSDNQPQIQFKKNLIKLQDKHTTRHITVRCLSSKGDSQEEERPPIEFMSVKQARQALMNGGECIIGKLEAAELQATANEIRVDGKQRSEKQELLNKHKSCFPKQLSNKLPP